MGSACLSCPPAAAERSVCSAGQAATRAWTGASPSLRPSGSAPMGEPVIQRALPTLGGKRDSFSRGKCLTTSSLPGWSGAPISQANQPGKGLILELCQVISSLVHFCSV